MTQKNWYDEYYSYHYKNKDKNRDDLLVNKEVIFQFLAKQQCIIKSLSKISLDKENSKIADIGCGSCTDLINLVTLGFNQKNLYGADINKTGIDFGADNFPLLNLSVQNATNLSFENNFFDLVYESTMFVQLTNQKVSEEIANEMIRITKSNGFLIVFDWRYGKINNKNFLSCDKQRIKKMFNVGLSTKLISIIPGMLIPPLGRFISKNLDHLYFPIAKTLPFLVGQVAYILKKTN